MGFGSSQQELLSKFEEATKLQRHQIQIVEVEEIRFKINAKTQECNPGYPDIDLLNHKLTVIIKKNCNYFEKYLFSVVAIIKRDVLEDKEVENLQTYLKEEILPFCTKNDRPCCSFNKGLKEQGILCKCQGNQNTGGFTATFGCTRTGFSKGLCKYQKKLQTNLRRFKLQGKDLKKEEILQETLYNLADSVSNDFEILTPEAFQNMSSQKSDHCKLGHQQKRPFTAVTIVADYTAHCHKDYRDIKGGAAVLYTIVKKDATNTQKHLMLNYKLKNNSFDGICFTLPNNSLLVEAAYHEWHGSTPLNNPNGVDPTRIGFVFFQHSGLTQPLHGYVKKK